MPQIIFLVLLALIFTGCTFPNTSNTPTSVPQPPATQTTLPPTTPISTSKYRNGEYTSTIEYYIEEGDKFEEITVTLTLIDDIIDSLNITHKETSAKSLETKLDFDKAVKPLVMGKKIDDLALSQVSGSSLTTDAFNEALENIKKQASVNQ